jgi:hypothetical protein
MSRREVSISQGDALDAEFEIDQERDELTGIWKNKTYRILKVRDVKKQPEQLSLPP